MKKNVAIITPSLSCGGGERAVSMLANYLCETGRFNIFIYVLINSKPFFSINSKIKLFYIDRNVKGKFFINAKRAKYIKNLNKENNIDLLIGYSANSALVACLASLNTSIKCIICERSYPKRYGAVFKIKRWLFYRRANGAVHQTTYVNNYLKNLVKSGTVIHNMIDVNLLPDYVPYHKRRNKIVTVGRLCTGKNIEMLIKAFYKIEKKFPDYFVEIYGDGPHREYLHCLIKSLNLKNKVFLMGESNDIFEKIKDAKLFVFTSNLEGYPNALLEAIVIGIPTISTDCPAFAPREMLSDFIYGDLVELYDHDGLAEKIEFFLKSNIDNNILKNWTIEARQKYDISETTSRWTTYIEKIIYGERKKT